MTFQIHDRIFSAGRNRTTGTYMLYQYKAQEWQVHSIYPTVIGLNNAIRHQRKLAENREARAMIADMCGTSYTAAMADMGMSRI